MSYYFVIVGTRDNPLYTADLASKPTTSGPASLFGSSGSSGRNASEHQSGTPTSNSGSSTSATGGGGGLFGFGGALGALAGGLSSSNPSGQRTASSAATAGTASSSAQLEGKGIGFGRYNDKHVLQMIAHSSLDVVEDKQFVNGAM